MISSNSCNFFMHMFLLVRLGSFDKLPTTALQCTDTLLLSICSKHLNYPVWRNYIYVIVYKIDPDIYSKFIYMCSIKVQCVLFVGVCSV